MTEESEGSSAVPGSSAGDAAPTQAIPRIPKPANGTAVPPPPKAAGRPTSRPAPARKPVPGAETDKGRPRQAPAPSAAAAQAKPAQNSSAPAKPAQSTSAQNTSAPAKPVASTTPAAGRTQQRTGEPIGGPAGHTLTAADYARTTKDSPATTAVIPAVKDAPAPKGRTKRDSPAATLAPAGTGRRASLRLTHIEPWSVTRLAFAISVAMMIVSVVAVLIFWLVLDAVGVWDQINDSFTTVLSDDSDSFNVTDYFGFGRVVGLTLVLSAVNVIVMTALATIAAHLYNLSARLMGGVEMTFAEDK